MIGRVRGHVFQLALGVLVCVSTFAPARWCEAQSWSGRNETDRASSQPDAAKPALAGAPEANRHIRVVEEEDGKIIKLQLSSRRFVPDVKEGADTGRPPAPPGFPPGPTVYLTGAVHIGDKSFYDEVQKFLDEKDVVLFESVKPPGAGSMKYFADTEQDRITATKRRVQLVALLLEQYKINKRDYPSDLSHITSGIDPKFAKVYPGLDADGWGRPMIYRVETMVTIPSGGRDGINKGDAPNPAGEAAPVTTSKFDLVSYGRDGEPGGEGDDADIQYSRQSPVNVKSLAHEEGIQAQMAQAMGLVFQLDAMSHDAPNWRNSDLSVDQVQDRLMLGGGADQADELFSMLSGDSFIAKIAGVALKLLSMFPSYSNMLKMMMVDMLASADRLMEVMPGGDEGGMSSLMDVIIKDRNQVVIDDLAMIARSEPDVRTVGILYGAGHLPDMEERLIRDLNYRFDGERWFTAITVDVTTTGMSVEQATSMRKMMKRMIEQQIKAASKSKKK